LALRLPMPGRFGEPPTCWGFSLPLPPQQHAPWTLTSRPGDRPCRWSSSNLALGAVARASCQRRRYARWAEPKREADAGERGSPAARTSRQRRQHPAFRPRVPRVGGGAHSGAACHAHAGLSHDRSQTAGLDWRSVPRGRTGHPGHLHGGSSLGPEDCTVDASSLGWAGAQGRRPNADAISVRRRATV
jgi:hypothetical protein